MVQPFEIRTNNGVGMLDVRILDVRYSDHYCNGKKKGRWVSSVVRGISPGIISEKKCFFNY